MRSDRKRTLAFNIKHLWFPVFLILLAFWELRIDIRLIFDHFTFMALTFAIKNHPLASTILIFSPSLIKEYYKSFKN